ncbi:head GIN domain-containing protein [Algibacter miyuki]|uniref:Head GIN domain-containing protein n=1 Tax=Algibacter miyuki TaxID=1306933 RepID=A0ABV5GZH1_9FLAO|nr:head GIN domain-containing protein [Algibacter miyuki]MDN3666766.1 head GIN domain-containing protein [Algibacter miyuki]
MTTLTKIIVATILTLCLSSCNFDININSGVKGNGKVQIETRIITAPFSTIQATEGLDVYLTHSAEVSVRVEADSNLQELILAEVKNGVLKIHTEKSIGRCTSKKVYVSFNDISKIKATSGSDVISTNIIAVNDLELATSSGSDMDISVNTMNLKCKSSSGSDLKVSGKTETLEAEATSGSDIDAKKLMAQYSEVKASSGADIKLNTEKTLKAKATSGGDITYYGSPKQVEKMNSSSGSVKKK